MLKVGSDFSGVGAFEVALGRLGIDYKVVFACDIDKYARQTYLANHPAPEYFPHDVYDRDIPKEPLDLLMTSPPCQSFSLAGKRGGESDDRGVLFYNSHAFIKQNRPRFFIFENVKGLLSDDEGKTFQRWLDYLAKSINGNAMLFPHPESVGYHVYWQVLNSKNFGVPQNRERVFIIGIRDDEDNGFNFPKGVPLEYRLKDILESKVPKKYFVSERALKGFMNSDFNQQQNIIQDTQGTCATLLSRDYKDPKCVNVGPKKLFGLFDKKDDPHQAGSVWDKDHISPALDTGQGGWRQPLILNPELVRLPDLKLVAEKRVHNTPPEINDYLRKHKKGTIKSIAKKLDLPITQVEHYFRSDNFRAIPPPEVWDKLKKLLGFDEQYDEQVTAIYKEAYTFESAMRLYSTDGLAQTLHTGETNYYANQEDKDPRQQRLDFDSTPTPPPHNSLRLYNAGAIRKLTPRECFRLQDFPDTFKLPCSDSQTYKQAGNSITCSVLFNIIKKLKL